MKRISLIILAAVAILIGFAPTLLSTSWGSKITARFFPSDAVIGSASLSWLGPQQFTDVTLTDSSITAEIPSLTVDRSFLGLIFTPIGDLTCTDALAKVDGQVVFSDISLSLQTARDFSASGKTPDGAFSVQLRGESIEIDITNLPVAAADSLLALVKAKYKGMVLDFFGDRASIQARGTFSPQAISGNAEITSPGLTTALTVETQDGRLMLTQPATFSWNLRQTFIDLFTQKFAVETSIPLEGTVTSLSLPYANGTFDIEGLACTAQVTTKNASILAPQPVSITTATIAIDSPRFFQELNLDVTATFGEQSTASVQTALVNWYPLTIESLLTNISARLTSIPLHDSELSEILGETISAEFTLANNLLELSATTPLLSLPKTSFAIDEAIKLTEQTTLTYQLPTQWEIASSAPLTVQLDTLSIPLNNWKQGTVSGKINSRGKTSFGDVTLSDLDMTFAAKELMNIDLQGTASLTFIETDLGLSFEGTADLSKERISPLTVTAKGDGIETTFVGAIDTTGIEFTQPATMTLAVTPDQVNPMLARNDLPLLAAPATFDVEVQVVNYSFKNPTFTGSARISSPSVPVQKGDTRFTLEALSGKAALDDDLSLSFSARATQEGQSRGEITFKLLTKNFSAEPAPEPDITIALTTLDTTIAQALIGTQTPLSSIVGPTITLDATIEQAALSLNVRSPLLNLKGDFSVTDALTLKNNRPLVISWSATPEGYAALGTIFGQAAFPITLADVAHIKATISTLSLPVIDKGLFPTIDPNPYKSQYDVMLTSDAIAFAKGTVNNLSLKLTKTGDSGPLTFDLATSVSPGGGRIETVGHFENLYDPSGAINLQNLTTDLSATLTNIPTSIIDGFAQLYLPADALPSNILGEKTNATLYAKVQNMNGPLRLEIDASNCQTSLDATLADSRLLLNKPLISRCRITPELMRLFIGDVDIDITSAKNPMVLQIDNRDFSFPLNDFTAASIPFFRLDLGQIAIRNSGTSRKLSDFLRLERSANLQLWFAPCDGRFANGKLYIERTEILVARRYQLALWGKVNFIKEYVDMVFGITAPAMQAALGISPPSSDYVLKVPLKGPFGNVRLDTDAAKKKVGIMVAGRAGKALAPQGSIWGGVLDAVGTLTDDQGDVPPPRRPFPWEQQSSQLEPNKAAEFNKKRVSKKSKSNFKELKKLLTSPS